MRSSTRLLRRPPFARFAAAFLDQPDLLDAHAPVDRLGHVVDREAGDGDGGQRLHLDAGRPQAARLGPHNEAGQGVIGGDVDQKVLALTERSKIARYSLIFVAFGLPLLLGLLATYVGATAMRVIEQSRGQYGGNFQAVFSIMIGGFASVIAGCMIFSMFVWPYMPSIYTR